MADRPVREFTTQAPAPYVGQFLQGGIFPYAQRFLQGQFANMGAPDSSPYTYTGPRVAQFDTRERMGMQMSDQAIGSYSPYLGSQSNLLGQATDYLRKGTGAGTALTGEAARGYRGLGRDFDPSAYKDYMSPYTENVIDRSLGDVREQMEKQKMGVRNRAVSAGAFGGSRGRLAEEDIERAGLRSMGDVAAGLREKGYGQSQEQAFQEFTRRQAERGGTAQVLAGLGQQYYGMGEGSAAGLGSLGGMYGGIAPALQNLQTGDINRTMQFGGLGRGRQQSLMDLGYQNFTGQYNLPMQTLQNVGALTASLGPMAGGYGYAGQGMPTEFAGGSAYQPAGGGIPAPGAGSYTPYSTGAGNYQPYTGQPQTPPPTTRGMRPGVAYPGGSASFNEFSGTANLGGGQHQSNLGGGPQTQPLAPVSPTNYNTYGNNMPIRAAEGKPLTQAGRRSAYIDPSDRDLGVLADLAETGIDPADTLRSLAAYAPRNLSGAELKLAYMLAAAQGQEGRSIPYPTDETIPGQGIKLKPEDRELGPNDLGIWIDPEEAEERGYTYLDEETRRLYKYDPDTIRRAGGGGIRSLKYNG